jgi:hypothetical protein
LVLAIEVACHLCGWKGTAHESVAGEWIACRACGASVSVPHASKEESAPDFEVLEDEAKKQPEKPPPTPEEEAKRKKIAAKKKLAKLLPPERSWLLSGRNLTYIGLAFLAAGVLTLIVDIVTNTSRIYPFILLGLGLVIALTGYVLNQEQSKN